MGGRRARPEEKASALAMYQDGVYITEIAMRTGFGTTTIFRWATEAGIVKPFSERIADRVSSKQVGREVIGKKGAFHTTKGDLWIPTDSTYELARLEQLELAQDVALMDRCRDRIPYHFGGRPRHYIPDFKLIMKDGSVIVEEVKPARWVTDPKVRAKVLAAQEFYLGRGVVFRVITEEDIGSVHLSAARVSANSRMTPENLAASKERRRACRAANQRAYVRRWKEKASPEELAAQRKVMAAHQRKYRKAKR